MRDSRLLIYLYFNYYDRSDLYLLTIYFNDSKASREYKRYKTKIRLLSLLLSFNLQLRF